MKISVCLATYNGEKYITEQLKSILTQLGEDDEIIISDDNSSDKTIEIINGFNDKRIKILQNKDKGITKNFENALKNASGDYLFLSDQDDVWLPQKVFYSLKGLEYYDLVVTNCKVTDENLNIINQSYFDLNNSRSGFLKNFYRSSYLGCCLAFKKEMLTDILPIPRNLYLYHDWWIGYLADIKYKVKFIDVPCLLYRRHDFNMSTTAKGSKRNLLFKVRDRFQLLYLGSLRLLKIL
ncbi:glycosyltransferase family 2 protein [Chryseobacterium sp. CT-SW4]|uniref:glycosyltransferase family 2 protein n=1 Tax=Chryseobacterium sp. SW-1 TaxID=3157343 RepID=UPI003B02A1FE